MAVILENRPVAKGIYRMLLKGAPNGSAGQFVMVREEGQHDPFLPRPLCIHDYDEKSGALALLYQVVGRGTVRMANMRPDRELNVMGPYGNGFPLAEGDATLIGGGMGIAPLLLLAKQLRRTQPERHIAVFLGYREEAFCEEAFQGVADEVRAKLGGFISDGVDFSRPGNYFACGPEPMLLAAHAKAKAAGATLYVSLEKRMACGVGACYACSIETKSGNRRVCKDGPVFPSGEVFFHA